jgi:hypothetical protein
VGLAAVCLFVSWGITVGSGGLPFHIDSMICFSGFLQQTMQKKSGDHELSQPVKDTTVDDELEHKDDEIEGNYLEPVDYNASQDSIESFGSRIEIIQARKRIQDGGD